MTSKSSKVGHATRSPIPPAVRSVMLVLSAVILVELIWLLALVEQHAPKIGDRAIGFFWLDVLILGICSFVADSWMRKNRQVGRDFTHLSEPDTDQSPPSSKPKKSSFPWKTLGLVALTLTQVRLLIEHWFEPVMVRRLLLISALMDFIWIDVVLLVILLINDFPTRRTNQAGLGDQDAA